MLPSPTSTRAAPPGLFSCLQRPRRRGDSHPQPSGSAGPGLRLLSEPSGLPPSHLNRNYIPSSAIPDPSAAPRHFIRLRESVASPTPEIYPHQRVTFWFNQVIFGRREQWAVTSRQRKGSSECKKKYGSADPTLRSQWTLFSGQQQQQRRLERTHQGCTIPAARPPLMCRRCC